MTTVAPLDASAPPTDRTRWRGSILVLPGGGYRRHAPHEAEPVARWLSDLGWHARVVRYPVGQRHPAPVDAVHRAIAAERAAGFVSVGVIGFSAGGHLAGSVATSSEATDAERPDFAVLGYPVVSMRDDPHQGSRLVLLGEHADEDAARTLSLETRVTGTTAPMFLWHTKQDPVVPVTHTRLLAAALERCAVEHEVHGFPGDVHGIGLADGTAAARWTALAADWLARR